MNESGGLRAQQRADTASGRTPDGPSPSDSGVSRRADEPQRGRLRGIEGLRALAASSIVVFHVWVYGSGAPGQPALDYDIAHKFFSNLQAGVTLFFILSGFLLYRPFAAAVLRGTPRPSLRRYGINRALRIVPAYWSILLIVALTLQHELLTRPVQLLANTLLLQHYVPAYQVVGGGAESYGILPAWSLAVEVVFYVSLPLLALLAGALAARRARRLVAVLAPVAVLVIVGMAAKLAFRLFPDELGRIWAQGFPTHADWFAAGMALAVARVLWEDDRYRLPRWWPLAAVTTSAALVAGSAKLWYGGPLLWNEYQAVVAVALALLLTLVVLADARSRTVAALEWRPLVVVGLASYSVFLWNDPIIRWLRDHGLTMQGEAGFVVNLFVICVIVGIASWLTYRFVEKPALARKPKSPPRATPSTEPDAFGSLDSEDLAAPVRVRSVWTETPPGRSIQPATTLSSSGSEKPRTKSG